MQLSIMPQEQQVVVVSPVQRKFHRTSPHLYASDRPRRRDLVKRPRVRHEKWDLMPAGGCLKLTAGFCHTVHFMVDAGKNRDAWTILLHERPSDFTRAPRMKLPQSKLPQSEQLQHKRQRTLRNRPS